MVHGNQLSLGRILGSSQELHVLPPVGRRSHHITTVRGRLLAGAYLLHCLLNHCWDGLDSVGRRCWVGRHWAQVLGRLGWHWAEAQVEKYLLQRRPVGSAKCWDAVHAEAVQGQAAGGLGPALVAGQAGLLPAP